MPESLEHAYFVNAVCEKEKPAEKRQKTSTFLILLFMFNHNGSNSSKLASILTHPRLRFARFPLSFPSSGMPEGAQERNRRAQQEGRKAVTGEL